MTRYLFSLSFATIVCSLILASLRRNGIASSFPLIPASSFVTSRISNHRYNKALPQQRWTPTLASAANPWQKGNSLMPHSVSKATVDFPVSGTPENNSGESDDKDEVMDDATLLQQTKKSQLVDLCKQFSLSTNGTKQDLLKRLREHAAIQVKLERQRLQQRKRRVEEGGDDDRERFEIVDDDLEGGDETDDEDFVFYYPSALPDRPVSTEKKSEETSAVATQHGTFSADESNTTGSTTNSQATLITPPPPPVEPNENGERVVTVYSTTDQNDLTGIAASQPGQSNAVDPMTSTLADPANAPWDTNNPQKNAKESASTSEIEAAKEEVAELVHLLLAATGAPGFQQDLEDDLQGLGVMRHRKEPMIFEEPEGFVGFDPASVPTELLTKTSRSLRTGRGSVLSEVLREYELKAVGHDGVAGDDTKRGGGHYRQVSKVRSFLEGYRRAEVRRLARETATMLLDKLVGEGIEGLDIALTAMTRSGDETSDEAGELNDSLLDYLNDVIRQQEKKVEQLVDSVKKITELETVVSIDATTDEEDEIEKLWSINENEGDEGGERVETFDPNLPNNRKALREEYEKSAAEQDIPVRSIIPTTAQEKLLLLLKLLRERVKTEAAFSHDEKSRNLRVLAYCINLPSDDHRKELIIKEFGSSLDRLDSFIELVSSSIEYGESTSHQLQPSKKGSLNVHLLKKIQSLSKNVRKMQSWKASGATSDQYAP